MGDSIHSDFSPSRMFRLIECPGSYQLSKQLDLKEESSIYAAEGTMLHDCTEKCVDIIDFSKPLDVDADVEDILKDRLLTPGQLDAVKECVNYLSVILATCGPDYTMRIEHKGSFAGFGLPEVFGYCDIVIEDINNRRIIVIDWKFGRGITVYASGNDQLRSYGLMAGLSPKHLSKFELIEMHIFQPRIDHQDEEILTTQQLLGWFEGRVRPGLAACEFNYPQFNPSEKSCQWCPVRTKCKHRHAAAQEAATSIFAEYGKFKEGEVDPIAIKQMLQKDFPLLEKYVKDLKQHIQTEIETGHAFHGFKVVRGRSIRKWAVADQEVALALMSLSPDLDVEDLFESKLKSPTKVEKLRRELKRDGDFLALVHKPDGKPTLAFNEDKREPIEYKDVTQIFSDVN